MNGVDRSGAGCDQGLKPESGSGKTSPLEYGSQVRSEADLRAACLNRPPDPTADPVVGWSRGRGSRAVPVEFMKKHDAAGTKMAREASDRARRVRNELQDVAADDSVERFVEVHCSRVAAPERDIRQRRRPDTPFRGVDCRWRGIGANY